MSNLIVLVKFILNYHEYNIFTQRWLVDWIMKIIIYLKDYIIHKVLIHYCSIDIIINSNINNLYIRIWVYN